MGKCCWITSLAIQQMFPIQILLPFPIFKLPPNFIFQCYRPQTWQFYLFFPTFSVSSIHEVLGTIFRVGRSRDSAKGLSPSEPCEGLPTHNLMWAKNYKHVG